MKIDEEDEDVPIEEAEEEAENIKQSLKNVEMNELDEKEALAKELDDEFFQEWVSILAKEPEQVIRYHRGIDSCVLPFEVTADGPKVCDPGQCSNCGAEREFEFQTTPHLLIKTGLDFIEDLATILVYTCNRDCLPKDGASFIRERAIKVHYKRWLYRVKDNTEKFKLPILIVFLFQNVWIAVRDIWKH